ncbi:hypothetical protein GQ600_20558 [Phytophthora cactorum]|nr:hypothetical protein GQ600_20558 [Phytophthora cactorum]
MRAMDWQSWWQSLTHCGNTDDYCGATKAESGSRDPARVLQGGRSRLPRRRVCHLVRPCCTQRLHSCSSTCRRRWPSTICSFEFSGVRTESDGLEDLMQSLTNLELEQEQREGNRLVHKGQSRSKAKRGRPKGNANTSCSSGKAEACCSGDRSSKTFHRQPLVAPVSSRRSTRSSSVVSTLIVMASQNWRQNCKHK